MPPSRGVKKPKEDKSNNRVLVNRYRVEKKLGSGNFGTAFLVFDLIANPDKGEEQWKVLKEIPCGDLAPDETLGAMHEAKLLSKLHHPNIVKFYDSFLDDDGEYFCIITEYCEGGDLDDKITACKKSGKTFEQDLVLDWFVQLVLAVQHMHHRRVLHRDLKTRNIFLKKNMIKIGDFGISRVLMGTTDMASTFTGTPYYMSPEVLKHEGYNSKSDVWSIACILYELCALHHAFEGQSLMGVMYKIVEGKTPEIPEKYDAQIQEVLKIMLNRDPSQRPSAAEVTKLPFVGRHIEKMRKRLVEFKEQRDEDAKKESQEIADLLREKTHLHDLQNESSKRRENSQLSQSNGQRLTNALPEHEEDPYKHLTPRERMRLRKMQQADQKAALISAHARKNLMENNFRKGTIQGTMSALTKPAWQVGRGEAQQLPSYQVTSHVIPSVPDYGYRDEGYDDDEDAYWQRDNMGTVVQVTEVEDHPARPSSRGDYLSAPSQDTTQDRPITPLKQPINLDDPDIAFATPPGLSPAGGSKVKQAKKSQESGSGRLAEIEEKIPDDIDAAETYYSQHEDFESDSELDDDYDALMDCMQDALDKTTTDQNATIIDNTTSAFSPHVRDMKIKNLRIECEKKMGKESFKKAYAFLKNARFGKTIQAGQSVDEGEIIKGLRKFVKNPSDGFLIDQLLFLEEQAKMI